MTSSTIPVIANSDRTQAARLVLPVAVVSTLLAAVLSYLGRHDLREWLVELAALAVGVTVIFGVVVPRGLRHEAAGGRALVMGVLGLVLVVPAFWLGLPVQLGAAAVLLGFAGRKATAGSGKAMAALVVGALTVIAYLAIYLGDYLNTH